MTAIAPWTLVLVTPGYRVPAELRPGQQQRAVALVPGCAADLGLTSDEERFVEAPSGEELAEELIPPRWKGMTAHPGLSLASALAALAERDAAEREPLAGSGARKIILAPPGVSGADRLAQVPAIIEAAERWWPVGTRLAELASPDRATADVAARYERALERLVVGWALIEEADIALVGEPRVADLMARRLALAGIEVHAPAGASGDDVTTVRPAHIHALRRTRGEGLGDRDSCFEADIVLPCAPVSEVPIPATESHARGGLTSDNGTNTGQVDPRPKLRRRDDRLLIATALGRCTVRLSGALARCTVTAARWTPENSTLTITAVPNPRLWPSDPRFPGA